MVLHSSYANNRDLLIALVDFLEDAGYTINYNANEGSGRRAHVQKGSDLFFNFRAYNNENTSGLFFGNLTHLFMNGSTGYNIANAWHRQPGAPVFSTNNAHTAGCFSSSAILNAWFFTIGSECVVVAIECPAGMWTYLMFGRLDKQGTWTGGQFFAGSLTANGSQGVFASAKLSFFGNNATENEGCVYIGADYSSVGLPSTAGWARSVNGASDRPWCTDIFKKNHSRSYDSPSNFNASAPLDPLQVWVTADGILNNASTPIIPLGVVPGVNMVNIQNFTDGELYTDLLDQDYRIFPIWRKGNSNPSPGFPYDSSGYFGVAIKVEA